MNKEEIRNSVTVTLFLFDKWTESLGLPNDTKPLKDITAKEYRTAIHKFFDSLNEPITFKQCVESFYSKNEIDFDYIDYMSSTEWIKLLLKIFAKYIEEGVITFEKYK